MIIPLTDETFEESISFFKPPTIVSVHAHWCAPCKNFTPIFDQAAVDFDHTTHDLVFATLNIDDGLTTALKYNINVVPTILIFNQGELVQKIEGAVQKERLYEILERYRRTNVLA